MSDFFKSGTEDSTFSGEEAISFTMNDSDVSVPSAESRRWMMLRIRDWKRMRRDIKRLRTWSTPLFSIGAFSLGIGAGAGLSLLSLYNATGKLPNGHSQKPKEWIVFVHIAVTSFSGGVGLIAFIVGTVVYFRGRTRSGDLETELNDVESAYPWSEHYVPPEEDPSPPPAVSPALTESERQRRLRRVQGR